MKKYRILSLMLSAVIAAVSFAGCSNGKESSSSDNGPKKQEGLAQTEIVAGIQEEKESNDTVFKLNRVIDSGKTDEDGNRFIYLDVTITNNTEKEYELNIINNFYISSFDFKIIIIIIILFNFYYFLFLFTYLV